MIECPHCQKVIENAEWRRTKGEPTHRELQVWRMLGESIRNKEIAAVLGVSPKTVSAHMTNLCIRLGISGGRMGLVREGVSRGIIKWSEPGDKAATIEP